LFADHYLTTSGRKSGGLAGVAIGVAVLVGVAIGVAVLVGVAVGVAVLVGVAVGVAVLVGVAVGVLRGDAEYVCETLLALSLNRT
jgi:hypothetical protein